MQKCYPKLSIISIFMLLILFSICSTFSSCSNDSKEMKIVKKVSKSIVRIITEDGNTKTLGTGFAIGTKKYPVKYFVTNSHVIQSNKDFVYIVYGKNNKVITNVLIDDKNRDIAILEVSEPINTIPPMIFANTNKTNVLDDVITLGYSGMYTDKLTAGFEDLIVETGIIKKIHSKDVDMFVHNTTLSQGTSGGPLINTNGDVIGINTSVKIQNGQTKASESISINELIKLIDSISGTKIPYTIRNNNNTFKYIILSILTLITLILAIVISHNIKKKNKYKLKKSYIESDITKEPDKTHSTTFVIKHNLKKIYLVGLKGHFSGETIIIPYKKFVIGRSKRKSNLTFPDKYVDISGIHCVIKYNPKEDSVYLKDESTNGTYLKNGTKLEKGVFTKIKFGTEFYISTENTLFKITDVKPD